MQWIFVSLHLEDGVPLSLFDLHLLVATHMFGAWCNYVQLLHLEVIIRSSCMIWIKTHYGTETTTNEFPIVTFDWFEEGSN